MIIVFIVLLLTLFLLSYVLPVDLSQKTLGSARFSTGSVLKKESNGFVIDGVHALDLKNSFRMGALLASTGSGKTTSVLVPSIIKNADHGLNIIALDPKHELHELTNWILEKRGYNVHVLDLDNVEYSISFNPVRNCKTENALRELAGDLYQISHGSSSSSDAIWSIGAKNLISIYLSCMLNMPSRYKCLDTLITLLSHTEDGTPRCEYFVQAYGGNAELQKFATFQRQDVKVKMGYLSTALAALHGLDTLNIRSLSAGDTFDFSELRSEKTALFLKLPAGSNSSGMYQSLFFTQLFRYLLRTDVQKEDRPILMYLEELPSIAKISLLPKAKMLLRSKRVGICSVAQNIEALEAVYGKQDTNTILANSNSLIALPGIRDERTLRYLSILMGEQTVESYSMNSNQVRMDKKPLLNMSETRTMDFGLFIHGNHQPEKITPQPIYMNQELMKLANLISVDERLTPIEVIETEKKNDCKKFISPDMDELINARNIEKEQKLEHILSSK